MSAYDRITGPELVQSTYFIEGKGWRTHHVISHTASFEREATPEEIEEAERNSPKIVPERKEPDSIPEQKEADSIPAKKRGRPRKAE